MSGETIATARLDLVYMSQEFLEACLAGEHERAEELLGLRIPMEWHEHSALINLRLAQSIEDPDYIPWLPRAIGLRDAGVMVGYFNFHSSPGPEYLSTLSPGGIEFGYEIFAAHQRRGYAQETLVGIMEWSHRAHNMKRFVLSISPTNIPSLGLARKLGFVKIGEHMDEEDGLEDVFERQMS